MVYKLGVFVLNYTVSKYVEALDSLAQRQYFIISILFILFNNINYTNIINDFKHFIMVYFKKTQE